MLLQLVYLCLQATREGQASYAHVREIIKGLKRRGWDVELFEPSYVKSQKAIGPFKRLMEFLRVQLLLWRRARNKRIDALYIRWHFASYPTALLARWCDIPVVQEVNGPYEDLFIAWPWTRRLKWLFTFLMRSQLKMTDAIITVTPHLAEWAKKEAGHNRVHIVPNGANTELFCPGAKIDPSLPVFKYPYVIFFGALAPWQGIETMLKALDDGAWPEDVRLVIAGDGAERSQVEVVATRTERLVYLGQQPYSLLPGLIANALAGLSPQNNRGQRSATGLLPLKLFETLACGVPVIVTDFPGMADLVREYSCGLVIPPDDPKALAEAVRYLYEHPKIRAEMGRRGRESVEKKHSWDSRADDTHCILLQLSSKEFRGAQFC